MEKDRKKIKFQELVLTELSYNKYNKRCYTGGCHTTQCPDSMTCPSGGSVCILCDK